ncbi:MAG: VOC family protein [Ostreibacterium sp.]
MSINIKQIHHVAYRCKDAQETIAFYRDYLNMDLILSIAEDKVPSTKEPEPYMHIFLDAGMGNILAFFELPTQPEMGKDPNTPAWVQHIALELATLDELKQAKTELESKGLKTIGITDHGIIQSIYFFDPNGHRLELTVRTDQPGDIDRLHDVANKMIAEWSVTKKAPKHAAWLHKREFSDSLPD